ncbi:MAG TPA: EF-Tu/IF-2/RF-3 family GTPase [Thermoplasmata archaeon]|nr:EF-Tu/IF-2/RF-3 family GTPase [Thermoplasmata archaeon]
MTRGVTIAVVGAPDIAKELGKKGTTSDLTLFNVVHDDTAVTIVEPTQFPEKFPPLLTALAMADQCLLVIPELSRSVAETIATVELTDVPTTAVLGPAVGDAEVVRAFKGGRLASAPRVPLDLPMLREMVESWSAAPSEGPVRVPIDHAFPVKGVGAVALGVVRRGSLKAHERLRLFPTPKAVEVRSIQVHDVDRSEATVGERVGVALKGVEADELTRGQILAPDGSLEVGPKVDLGPLERCRYYRGDAGPGAQLHLSLGLQVVPADLDSLDAAGTRLTADRPVAFGTGDHAYLIDLSVPTGPRIFGRASANRASTT